MKNFVQPNVIQSVPQKITESSSRAVMQNNAKLLIAT